MNSVAEAALNALNRVEASLDGEVGVEVAQLVVSRFQEFGGGRMLAAIYRLWDDRLWLVAQAGYAVVLDGIGLDYGVIGRGARTGQIQQVPHGELDPDWVGIEAGFTSQLVIPVGDHLVTFEFMEEFAGDPSPFEGFAKRFVRRVRAARSSTVPGGDIARSLVSMVNMDDAGLISEYALRVIARYAGMESARIVVFRPDRAPLTAGWQIPGFDHIPETDEVIDMARSYRGFSTALVPGVDGPDSLVVPLADDRGFRGGIVGRARGFDGSATRLAPVAAVSAHTVAMLHRVELEESLREAHEARSEFIAALSHELRTPLTAVVGYGEMLVEGVDDPGDRKEFAVAIRDSAEHLLSLVSDVLDVARSDAGRLVIGNIESLRLQEIVADVVGVMASEATRNNVELTDEVSESIVVEGNAQRVKQIMLNLLSNAVKYSRDAVVRIEAERSGPSVIIRVEDQGEGIAPAVMAELFQAFSGRSAETGRSGTGLGLVISRRLAEAMDGSLHLESEGLGHGTTAVLSLPAGDGPDAVGSAR